MKLTQIALRNFRSGQNLTLDLNAPRVYICGRNGVGKSSIKDAIRWVLRGVCQSTDAKGQGWEELIPEGMTVLSAGVVLDGIGGVERTYKVETNKRILQLEGRDNDISSSQNAIDQLLNTTPEFLDAVLETSYFLDLHHAEAKAMVLGLLNVQIPVGQEMLTLLQVESRYKTAFQDWTLAKARQKAHVVPPFTIPAEGLMAKPEDIKLLLESLRVELQSLVGQSGVSAGRRAELERRLALETAKPVYPEDPEPSDAEVQGLASQVLLLEEAFQAAQNALASRPAALQKAEAVGGDSGAIRERIAVLSAHRPTKGCVLDANVSCDTARLKFTNQVKVYKSQLEALPVPEVEPEAPLPVFDHAALASARQKLAEARKVREKNAQVERHNWERSQEIDALTAQLRSLDAGPVPVDHSTAIDTLKARIAKGEKVLEHATEFWRQHKAHETAVATAATLHAQVNQLEMLCELLGPNGARVEALAKAIGAFEERINATTQAFGWTVAFELDPWTVRVNGRTLDAYSESEAFRIGIAIQIAVAVTSGLGFLVVDRLDMLDVDNRGIVTKMLLGHTDEIQQVIILATREIGQPLPAIPRVKAVRLSKEGQKTVVVEQNALAEMVA